jgi:hypothetical protein
LNNALDNAFEASRGLSGVREICLKSYLKGTFFFIEVENSFEGNIIFDRDTELPITNKTDKHLHGIGMSNIQKCARKYMGDLDIEISSCGESESTLHRTRNTPTDISSGWVYQRETVVCETFMRLATSACVKPCAVCAAFSARHTLVDLVIGLGISLTPFVRSWL